MKVIYIAGKYRDPSEYQVRLNIRNAEDAALEVWINGGVALCPHKNTAGFGGALGISDRTWLLGDFELIKRCDAVYAIGDWPNSAGALEEIKLAIDLNIPILYSSKELRTFLQIAN